jgi:hypothetical protein
LEGALFDSSPEPDDDPDDEDEGEDEDEDGDEDPLSFSVVLFAVACLELERLSVA